VVSVTPQSLYPRRRETVLIVNEDGCARCARKFSSHRHSNSGPTIPKRVAIPTTPLSQILYIVSSVLYFIALSDVGKHYANGCSDNAEYVGTRSAQLRCPYRKAIRRNKHGPIEDISIIYDAVTFFFLLHMKRVLCVPFRDSQVTSNLCFHTSPCAVSLCLRFACSFSNCFLY
jgi:hypothetical protein